MIQALGWLLLLGAFFLDLALEAKRADKEEREPAPPSEPPPEWSTGAIKSPMTGVVWVYVACGGQVWRGAWDGGVCGVQWVGDVSSVPTEVLDEAEGKAIQRVGWAA